MKRKNISYLISLSVSIVLALAIGALVLALTGYSPARAYGEMLRGAFSNARHIGDTLEYAMVLCICALACIVGAKAGIFNVGGEGQLLLGAIVAAQIGVVLKGHSAWLAIPCAILGAMAMGAAYAFIPGILKVKLKVSEVITTIMLNTVAVYICQYLAKGPWKNPNNNIVAGTGNLPSAAVAFFVWYVLKKTAAGYEIRLTGQNPRFAFFAGMKTDRIVLLSMLVSGAMCGLVGMLRVYGAEHIFKSSVSNDYYFEGLMVAMIARYEPVTAIAMSLLFAVLKIGAAGMELNAKVPNQIYLIIQTLVIFFMAAEGGVRSALAERLEARRRRREAESHA